MTVQLFYSTLNSKKYQTGLTKTKSGIEPKTFDLGVQCSTN